MAALTSQRTGHVDYSTDEIEFLKAMSDKNDGGQAHPSDTKQGKPSGYPQGIIGQANVPPSGTQYRSDRIPPAYDVYKRDKQRSFLTLVEILNVLRSLGWHKS